MKVAIVLGTRPEIIRAELCDRAAGSARPAPPPPEYLTPHVSSTVAKLALGQLPQAPHPAGLAHALA